jgi:hypothetical protein
MSTYTYVSDFGAKDGLDSGDSNKVIKGADFETEFTAIQTAVNSKPDYAIGTFTPVVADAVSGGNTATMNSAQGRYTKVGRMVHVTIQLLNINTTGMSSSSQLYVRDLPFTAYDNDDEMKWVGSLFSAGVATADAAHGPWVPVISDNNDWLSFLGTLNSSSTLPDSLKVSDILTNGADIFLSISYEAA